MPAAAVVAVGAVAGAAISANAAKSAASKQASAIKNAQKTLRMSAAGARAEILDRFDPAMANYRAGISDARDAIINSEADVLDILENTSGQAAQILDNAGADSKRAILGSQARSQGIPMETFMQQYESGAYDAPGMVPTPNGPAPAAGEPGGSSLDIGGVAGAEESMMTPGMGLTTEEMSGGFIPAEPEEVPMGGNRFEMFDQPQEPLPDIGFSGADARLQEGLQSGLAAAAAGTMTARGDVSTARDAALERFSPYSIAGKAAMEKEAALSGAMGPEAQQAAIDAYIESPGQKYLRERQEKALLRNSAAIGGLGGGNVRTALQEQAMGIASTQQQQHLENLRSIASRGQQVAGAEAGIITGAGTQLAQLAQQLGMTQADLLRMNASERGALAERTGLNVAQIESEIGQAQARLASVAGGQMADVVGQTGLNLANLSEREASTELQAENALSSYLANLATGTGSQIANLQTQGGATQAAGTMAAGQAAAQGVQGVTSALGYGLGNVAVQPAAQPSSLPVYQTQNFTQQNPGLANLPTY